MWPCVSHSPSLSLSFSISLEAAVQVVRLPGFACRLYPSYQLCDLRPFNPWCLYFLICKMELVIPHQIVVDSL